MRRVFSSEFALLTGLGLLLVAGLVAAFGPPERTLGSAIRIVYLHGAFVWTALLSLFAAALIGLWGLVTRRGQAHLWSRAYGRTGLLFWIGYLPLSMWAANATWNGVFLAEPRFRVAFAFAGAGLLLQLAAYMLEQPAWSSMLNLGYFGALVLVLADTERVMHPVSPIRDATSLKIQLFFLLLLGVTCLAGLQFSRWQQARTR